MVSSSTSSASTQSTGAQASAIPGNRSLAMTLALVPSLLVVGGLHAQTAPADANSTAQPAKPAPAAGADKDVVELESLEVIGERETAALSSPKFTQPLVDVPQTFTVVPQEVFNQQGAQTLSDVLKNTPGITFTAGEGGNVASGDTFTMRGFDASNSIFIDGVRSSGAFSRDIYNVEQVEIAKGPAGADNGRGGASGYVNLVTKTPKAENFVRSTVSYGVSEGAGQDQRRATLDVNQTVGTGEKLKGAAFRLNAYGQDSGVPGRDFVENTGYGVAPSLAFGLGTPTRIIVAGAFESQDNLPDSGLPTAGLKEGLYLDPAGPTPNSNVLVPTTSPIAGDISNNFYGFADHDYDEVITRSLLARIEHDITPDVRLSNQTKLADASRDSISGFIQGATAYNPATGQVTVRRLHSQTDNEILSNQTNLITTVETGPIQHDLSIGIDLSRESQYSPTYTAGDSGTVDALNPDAHRDPIFEPTYAPNSPFNKARIDTAALYAFDTLHLNERLMLNLSGRLERYSTDYTTLAADTTAPLNTTPTKLSGSDTLFSYKTGLVFKTTKDSSLYAAYGNGFTPPGTTFTLSNAPGNANDPATDPQEAHNYEIGLKWDLFEKRVSTSLAFYRSINENVATNLGTNAAPNYVYDTEQRSEGIEFGISGKITPEWLVFGGVGYIETETSSQQTTTDGADLRYTPQFSANLWTTYALFRKLTIGGGFQYTETVTRSSNNTVAGSTTNTTPGYVVVDVPSYWVFSALAQYAVTPRFSLRLNVDNLFDEDYYRVNNNGGRYYPGESRSYTLSADFAF